MGWHLIWPCPFAKAVQSKSSKCIKKIPFSIFCFALLPMAIVLCEKNHRHTLILYPHKPGPECLPLGIIKFSEGRHYAFKQFDCSRNLHDSHAFSTEPLRPPLSTKLSISQGKVKSLKFVLKSTFQVSIYKQYGTTGGWSQLAPFTRFNGLTSLLFPWIN